MMLLLSVPGNKLFENKLMEYSACYIFILFFFLFLLSFYFLIFYFIFFFLFFFSGFNKLGSHSSEGIQRAGR